MMNPTDYQHKRALRKAKEIRNFYIAVLVYCIVIPSIIVVNYVFSPEYIWWWYSASGMLLGLLIHGIIVFGKFPFLTREWEEKKVRELMDKEKEF